jgi:hypothetical protein
MNIDGDNLMSLHLMVLELLLDQSAGESILIMVRVRLKIYSYYLIPNQKET